VLSSLLAASCGGGDDDGNASDDAAIGGDGEIADGGGPDAPTDAADTATCASPDSCDWLEGYLGEVLRKLTGVEPAAPGVTITRRASAAQRDVARQFLVDELTRIGLSPTLHDYGSGKNIVVHLPSTTGSTMPRLVVGAHFDGVSAGPAAADNGTGTAIVVAAARYLASRPSRDRAIDLVLFDQEEGGLIGSTAYALKLRNDNTPVDSVHVMDMISYDGDGDGTLELWKPDAALEALYRAHAGRATSRSRSTRPSPAATTSRSSSAASPPSACARSSPAATRTRTTTARRTRTPTSTSRTRRA
jgi:hypothetical protein